jgi:hypothetical protein
MDMTYSADVDRLDEPLYEAAKERTAETQPIRIRVQPAIYRPGIQQHRMWPGVSWTLDCRTVEEAIAFRETMRVFFEQIALVGPDEVQRRLTDTP